MRDKKTEKGRGMYINIHFCMYIFKDITSGNEKHSSANPRCSNALAQCILPMMKMSVQSKVFEGFCNHTYSVLCMLVYVSVSLELTQFAKATVVGHYKWCQLLMER